MIMGDDREHSSGGALALVICGVGALLVLLVLGGAGFIVFARAQRAEMEARMQAEARMLEAQVVEQRLVLERMQANEANRSLAVSPAAAETPLEMAPPLAIYLSRDGKIFIAGTELTRDELEARLSSQTSVRIEADPEVKVGPMTELMDLLSRRGVRDYVFKVKDAEAKPPADATK
jgi:biopolymer transport protein ExbD